MADPTEMRKRMGPLAKRIDALNAKKNLTSEERHELASLNQEQDIMASQFEALRRRKPAQ